MSSLSAFMKPEALERVREKFVASERFKDEEGKPVEWELVAPTPKELSDIMDACTRRIPVNRARTQFTQETDRSLYLCRMVAAAVKYPNLNDPELQEFYHVKCAEDLVRTMLHPGEYDALLQKVSEMSGYEQAFQSEVEYVKN